MDSLFNKGAGLQAYNFTKNRLQYRCFPILNIEKFLRTLFLNNICKRLLLIGVQRIELTFCSDYLLGNLIKKRLRHRCFLWICESCKNIFFIEKPLVAASYDGLNLQDFTSLELLRVILFLLFFQCFLLGTVVLCSGLKSIIIIF